MQRVMWSQYGMVPKISKGIDNEAGTEGRAQSQSCTCQRQTPTVSGFSLMTVNIPLLF